MPKPTVILGIHDGHNASACVLIDGKVEWLVQEERLIYEKNAWRFPIESVKRALRDLNLAPGDIDRIAFNDPSRVPRTRTLDETLAGFRRLLTPWGRLRMTAIHALGKGWYARLRNNTSIRADLVRSCGLPPEKVVAYGHHECHAAAAYFSMRNNSSAPHLVLTLDGAGERHCSTVSIASAGRLERIAATANPHSLGAIYAIITYLMGFVPYEHEYKLMGMAPYCPPQRAAAAAQMFHRYLGLRPDGLGFERKTLLAANLQGAAFLRDMRLERFDIVMAGIQAFTEDLMVEWTRRCVAHTGIRRVVCGGGVFMNVKANKKIMELPEVEYLGVMPSCGDESLSYGAAALAHRDVTGKAEIAPWGPIYFGPAPDDAETERLLQDKGLPYARPDDIELEIAKLLVAGRPVARCRGRMEFGARALGNRSILADPSLSDSVRIINQMVKKRDFWMPFAPMVIAERADEYVRNPKGFGSPHMMLSFDTTAKFPEFIAAVHNADLTARPQILRQEHNPDMYRCLKHFESLTGRGIVLNTSFNLHGYPICVGAKEALHVFENSGLEHLALGSFLVSKRRAD